MGRLGYGAGRFRRAPRAGIAAEYVHTVSPDQAWTGAPSSGFVAPPQDPTRVTAKPAMSLIVPHRQAFTDELLVGVYAGANYRGSLLDNMGLEKVVAHYEGRSVEIRRPTFETFENALGNSVTYYGWWVRLAHNGTNGVAELYFEAVPKDSTMQNRVTGPFVFLPSATQFDHDLSVAPSMPVVAGSRYQSIQPALQYLKSVGAQHPRILVVEEGTYGIDSVVGGYTGGQGRCLIEADVPVTIGLASDTKGAIRPRYDNITLRGPNITLDTRFVSNVTTEVSDGGIWLDGIAITNSDPAGRDWLWDKGPGPSGGVISPASGGHGPWFTECSFTFTRNSAMRSARLVRGCLFTNVAVDIATSADCVIASTVYDDDARGLRTPLPAMTVHYTGAGASATLSLVGGADTNNRVMTAKVDGATVGTFTMKNGSADVDGAFYNVSDVVQWLGALPGWSATLIDDTRRATALGMADTPSVGVDFKDIDARTAPITLTTQFDFHVDFYQRNGAGENIVIADNNVAKLQGQNFLIGNTPQKDLLFINNAFESKESGDATKTQIGGAMSHGVFVNNSWSDQPVLFRPDDMGFSADAYCLFAANAVKSLSFGSGAPNIVVKDNHGHEGQSMAGAGATTGGDKASLFANAAEGDFTPQGELMTNLKAPMVRYDRRHVARGAAAAAGARA